MFVQLETLFQTPAAISHLVFIGKSKRRRQFYLICAHMLHVLHIKQQQQVENLPSNSLEDDRDLHNVIPEIYIK